VSGRERCAPSTPPKAVTRRAKLETCVASLHATVSRDGSAKAWDAVTGKLLLSFDGHADWVDTVEFSPDARSLLTASADGTVRSWELPQELRSPAEVARLIELRAPMRFQDGMLVPVLRSTNKSEQ
jgi:WD40 repeat protein